MIKIINGYMVIKHYGIIKIEDIRCITLGEIEFKQIKQNKYKIHHLHIHMFSQEDKVDIPFVNKEDVSIENIYNEIKKVLNNDIIFIKHISNVDKDWIFNLKNLEQLFSKTNSETCSVDELIFQYNNNKMYNVCLDDCNNEGNRILRLIIQHFIINNENKV